MRRPVRINGDPGVTLIELLVTIAILGIAFVAVLTGIATSAVTADQLRNQAGVDAALRTAAEQVKAAPYSSCGPAEREYRKAVTLPPGFLLKRLQVVSWPPAGDPPSCLRPDPGLQRLTLTVQRDPAAVTDDRGAEATLELIKRDADRAP